MRIKEAGWLSTRAALGRSASTENSALEAAKWSKQLDLLIILGFWKDDSLEIKRLRDT
jgi:hypothetical protein